MTGGDDNVKPANVAVPPKVVTLTLPDAPAPTVAVMLVVLFTAKLIAAVPPKLTAVTALKLVPVMVTFCEAPALVGVKEVTVGAAGTIAMLTVVLLEPTLLAAVTVNIFAMLPVVGVPLKIPVVASKLKPVGKVVGLILYPTSPILRIR